MPAGQGGVGEEARRPNPVAGQVDPRQPGGVDRRRAVEPAARRDRRGARDDHAGQEPAGHHVFLPKAGSCQVGPEDGPVRAGFSGTVADGRDDRMARRRLAGRRRLDRRVHRGVEAEDIAGVRHPPQASVKAGGGQFGAEVAPAWVGGQQPAGRRRAARRDDRRARRQRAAAGGHLDPAGGGRDAGDLDPARSWQRSARRVSWAQPPSRYRTPCAASRNWATAASAANVCRSEAYVVRRTKALTAAAPAGPRPAPAIHCAAEVPAKPPRSNRGSRARSAATASLSARPRRVVRAANRDSSAGGAARRRPGPGSGRAAAGCPVARSPVGAGRLAPRQPGRRRALPG